MRFGKEKLPLQLPAAFQLAGGRMVDCNAVQTQTGWQHPQADPYFTFELEKPTTAVRLNFCVNTSAPGAVQLFFAAGKSGFCAQNSYLLGASGYPFQAVITFPMAVNRLRFDPVDNSESFEIEYLTLQPEEAAAAVNEASMFGWLPGALAEKGLAGGNTVCLFTHNAGPSGAPMLCRSIAAEMRRQGYKTILVSYQAPTAPGFYDAADLFLVCPQQPEAMRAFVAALSLAGVGHALLNTVVTAAWARLLHAAQIPAIALVHEMQTAIRLMHMEQNCRLLQAHCPPIVFSAQAVKQDFERVIEAELPPGQACILANAHYRGTAPLQRNPEAKAEVYRQLQLPSNAVLLCGSGVIQMAKGLDIMPLVLAKMKKWGEAARRPVHLLWMGHEEQPQYLAWVQSQTEKMGLAGHLHLTGFVADGQQYARMLAASDVFVLPSREDSMPSVLLEAMAAKVPVVAFSQSGGAQDLLQNGRGLLAPYMDIDGFCLALQALLEQPALYEETVQKAYAFFKEQGSFGAYVKALLELL